jgi:hypothetical protein
MMNGWHCGNLRSSITMECLTYVRHTTVSVGYQSSENNASDARNFICSHYRSILA